MEQANKDIGAMPDFVAQWNPVWALAAPMYSQLGWRAGLQALYAELGAGGQDPNTLESIDGSHCWSLETS